MFTLIFWKAAAERAVKTLAQTAALLLGASAVGVLEADWVTVASLSGMAGVISVLTSLGSYGITQSPSLVSATPGDHEAL